MALYRKMFFSAFSFVMLATSYAVASLDNNMFELDLKQVEAIQAKTNAKMAPCEKIDYGQELEYRDCLADAAIFALSYRNKNDAVTRVFDTVMMKIDDTLRPGAYMLMAKKAVEGLNDTKNSTLDRATYFEVIKNLIVQIPKGMDDYKPIFEYLKSANLEPSDDVVNERLHRMGLKTIALNDEIVMALDKKVSKSISEVSE